MISKPYAVYVNNLLAVRTVTYSKAAKQALAFVNTGKHVEIRKTENTGLERQLFTHGKHV